MIAKKTFRSQSTFLAPEGPWKGLWVLVVVVVGIATLRKLEQKFVTADREIARDRFAKVEIDRTPIDTTLIQKFVGMTSETFETNLRKLSTPGLMKVHLKNPPWSSTFLPAKTGYASNPYADPKGWGISMISLPYNYGWYHNRRIPWQNETFRTMTQEDVNQLSPAEKYDLLVGTYGSEYSLTGRLWEQAIQLKQQSGMTFWTGMCHGWAPASIAVPAPKKPVQVKSVEYRVGGKTYQWDITFFPDDIKQLVTLSWANSFGWSMGATERPEDWEKSTEQMAEAGRLDLLNMGSRCKKFRPKRVQGRIVADQDRATNGLRSQNDCDDLDPAAFHLSAVHLLAKQSQSFVLDVDFNTPVNNHPVTGYQIRYFHPDTGTYGNYRSSVVPMTHFGDDVLRDFRTVATHSIIGVEMEIFYAHWKNPKSKYRNEGTPEKETSITYLYDLEIDRDGNVVGGEWRHSRKNRTAPFLGIRRKTLHPDFIWYPRKDFRSTAALHEYRWIEPGKPGWHLEPFVGDAWREDGSYINWGLPEEQSEEKMMSDQVPSVSIPHEWRERAFQAILVQGTNFSAPITDVVERQRVCPGLASDQTCYSKYAMPQPLSSIVYRLVKWSRIPGAAARN
jgi:hypothetical protein